MANTRTQVELTKQFFTPTEEEAMETPPPFLLPASPTELTDFLANGKHAKQYKNNFSKVIDDLSAWASTNALDTTACANFKNEYMEYSGVNNEQNVLYFHVYHEGIATLSKIITLLNEEKIPLDFCISTIQNLFNGMQECGPGVYTNIDLAHSELMSHINSSAYWMHLRKKMAITEILKILNAVELTDEARIALQLDIMELHYANAILNKFRYQIGIKPVDDENIKYCHPDLLSYLQKKFKACYRELFSLDNVITAALAELPLERLAADCGTQLIPCIEELESSLARLGAEPPKRCTYSRSDILEYNDASTKLRWNAHLTLQLSIYQRLLANGYISKKSEFNYKLNQSKRIHSGTPISILHAYVHETGQTKISHLTTYLYDCIINVNLIEIDELKSFFNSNQIHDTARYELMIFITLFPHTHIRNANQQSAYQALLNMILHSITEIDFERFMYLILNCDLNQFDTIINELTPQSINNIIDEFNDLETILVAGAAKFALLLLNKLTSEKLFSLFCSQENIFTVFSYLDNNSERLELLKLLARTGNNHHFTRNCSQVTNMLLKFPMTFWPDIIELIGVESITTPTSLCSLPATRKKLSANKWNVFIFLLGGDNLISVSPNFNVLLLLLEYYVAQKNWGKQLQLLTNSSLELLFNNLSNLHSALTPYSHYQQNALLRSLETVLFPQLIRLLIDKLSNDPKSQNTDKIQALNKLLVAISTPRSESIETEFFIWSHENANVINANSSQRGLFTPVNPCQEFVKHITNAYRSFKESPNNSPTDSARPIAYGSHL